MRYEIIPDFVIDESLKILKLLIAKKYLDIECATKGVRVSAEDMHRVINDEFKVEIYDPGIDVFLQFTEITRRATAFLKVKNEWYIEFPLWVVGEGASDIIVKVLITQNSDDCIIISLLDIRVM